MALRQSRPLLKYRREGCLMSIPQSASGRVQSRDDLVRQLSKGCRPKADWRIGTEHEKFVYDLRTHKPLAYDGEPGIRQLLKACSASAGSRCARAKTSSALWERQPRTAPRFPSSR